MDHANLRRKDTTKGPPLRILSLDGGGVRGYSMLIILQELMYRSFVETVGRPPKREEIPKPADYFDLIGGTGTGGLIAIMLGRLRLDLETCMDVYVRMTKKVFETDKTIAGIPYKHTLFKASKLEEAIKACVKEHTYFEDEGNDGTASGGREITSPTGTTPGGVGGIMSPAEIRRSMSVRSQSSITSPGSGYNRNSSVSVGFGPTLWGNPDASLYDDREKRTKTAVTAVYKGTNSKTGSSILLRSYDSRKEPPPEFNCTIWQAGRATSATGLAFKPIQIGQSVFLDEGAGKYNPSPQILEEAVVNEWPGRELGIFVSIGTGKRSGGNSQNSHEWWEGFVGGSMGSFAEARRRLISKIEGCEDIHVQMMNTELPKRGIPIETYCRLNVEVGVGEFGMNEWDRLSDMTTNTRKYLQKPETQALIAESSSRIAKIELMKRRMERTHQREHSDIQKDLPMPPLYEQQKQQQQYTQAWPAAVELPAEDVRISHSPSRFRPNQQHSSGNLPYPNEHRVSSQDKYMVVPDDVTSSRTSAELPSRSSHDSYVYNTQQLGGQAPPIPPKTPINDPMPSARIAPLAPSNRTNNILPRPPYPDMDAPPPVVNKLRKPEYVPR